MALIPNDNIYDILLKQPLKSLIRFKSVCNGWRNLITSPKFVQNHHQKAVENPEPNALLVFQSKTSFYMVTDISNSLYLRPTKLSLPRAFRDDPSTKIIGSCNGLICMGSGKFLNNYFIFNPTNPCECKVVPFAENVPSTSRKKPGRYIDNVVSGFGYDHQTDDYKIVYIWHWTRYKGLIYSLKSDCWKPLHVPDMGKQWSYCGALSNYLHYVTETNNAAVIQFDLFNEEWGVVYLPRGPHGIRDVCIVNGYLSCVVVLHNYEADELWIMKEYGVEDSWTKVLSLPYRGCCRAIFYSARLQQFLLYREFFGLFWYGSEEVECGLVFYSEQEEGSGSKEEELVWHGSDEEEGSGSMEEEEEITRVDIEGELKISDIRVIIGSLVSVESLHRQRENNLLESQKDQSDSKEAENLETNSDSRRNNKNKKNKKKNRA